MKRTVLPLICAALLLAALVSCDNPAGGGTDADIDISFLALSANGSSGSVTTTLLTLEFDQEPAGLTVAHISVNGADKGSLEGAGMVRTLSISSISVTDGSSITVSIEGPGGYSYSPGSRTVAVYVSGTPGTPGGSSDITGNTVTSVSNCISFISGNRFTATGSIGSATYQTKRIPVSLASSSPTQVEPLGDAILFARHIMNDSWSLYYLLKGNNSSNDDFKYVYAQGLVLSDSTGTLSERVDSTLYGHLREIDTTNQTSHNIGLRPDDEGYFFTTSPVTITQSEWDSIDTGELTTTLGLNESGPNLNLHTEVDAEFTVLGYRYGERDGVTGLEISIQNTGTTAAILSNARVFFMDGDDITLYHGSFTRFPTGGLVAPGAVGGFFKAANDLGNASADKLMILLNFKDPALN